MVKTVQEMNMTERWEWLRDHPVYNMDSDNCKMFWQALPTALEVDFVMVDPETETVEKDEARNTAVRCWLEMGTFWRPEDDPNWPDRPDYGPLCNHDVRLDSGGETFEDAFLDLCLKVLEFDGDYERTE